MDVVAALRPVHENLCVLVSVSVACDLDSSASAVDRAAHFAEARTSKHSFDMFLGTTATSKAQASAQDLCQMA